MTLLFGGKYLAQAIFRYLVMVQILLRQSVVNVHLNVSIS